jgi:hypothetical protein
MLRPYDDLSPESKKLIASASVQQTELDAVVGRRRHLRRPALRPVGSRHRVGRHADLVTGHITIVGLGPGGREYVTQQTLDAIDATRHRFVRTTKHPSAALVPDATSFDDVYEAADTFADVYAEITRRLVEAAGEHGDILYAVPGSPLVLETVGRAPALQTHGSSAPCFPRCRSSTSPTRHSASILWSLP